MSKTGSAPSISAASTVGQERLAKLNDPFVRWVITISSSIYLILKVPGILQGIEKVPWLRWLHLLPNASAAADALQVVATLLLLGPCWMVRAKVAKTGEAGRQIAVVASEQFQSFWVWLIATWLLFYLFMFLRAFAGGQSRIWDGGIDFLNNLQGVLLFLCYYVLTAITVADDYSPKRGAFPYALLSVGMVLFFIADVVTPGGEQTRMVFRLLSGLWVGVTMGLLVGCLESEFLQVVRGRYLRSRRVVVGLLYLYAVLQVAYVGFGSRYEARNPPDLALVENFASFLSLPLKLLFIGICYWLLREGRLEFYMEKTRSVIETTEADWAKFRAS